MEFAKRYILIIVTILALGLVSYQIEWYLEEQDYQRELADAKKIEITKIESTQWKDMFMLASRSVYVTVTNQGTNDVDGLTLVAEYTDSDTKTEHLGLLKAGQSKTVTFGEIYGGSSIKRYTIMVDDKIVYEQ